MRVRLLVFLALILSFVYLLFGVVVPSAQTNIRDIHGYIGYYAATRLFLEEGWSPQAYDNDWFIAYTKTYTQNDVAEIIRPNLPTVVFLVMPVGFLEPQASRVAWTWGNFGLLLLSLFLIIRTLQSELQKQKETRGDQATVRQGEMHPREKRVPDTRLWPAIMILSFVFAPVARNFVLGQAYVVIFFLFSVAFYGIAYQKDWLVGISLGAALALKTGGVLLWLLLLFQHRRKTLIWGMGTFLLLALISLPRIGLDTWAAYLISVSEVMESPILTATAYQTIPAFLAHHLRYHEFWSPAPVIDFPALARALSYLTAIAMLTVTLWRGRQASRMLLMAALLTLNTILVPQSAEHQYTVLLIPIAILGLDMVLHPSTGKLKIIEWLLFIGGIGMVGAPLPYKHPLFAPFWFSLLAYPRLYGGLLIWAIAMRRISNHERKRARNNGIAVTTQPRPDEAQDADHYPETLPVSSQNR